MGAEKDLKIIAENMSRIDMMDPLILDIYDFSKKLEKHLNTEEGDLKELIEKLKSLVERLDESPISQMVKILEKSDEYKQSV